MRSVCVTVFHTEEILLVLLWDRSSFFIFIFFGIFIILPLIFSFSLSFSSPKNISLPLLLNWFNFLLEETIFVEVLQCKVKSLYGEGDLFPLLLLLQDICKLKIVLCLFVIVFKWFWLWFIEFFKSSIVFVLLVSFNVQFLFKIFFLFIFDAVLLDDEISIFNLFCLLICFESLFIIVNIFFEEVFSFFFLIIFGFVLNGLVRLFVKVELVFISLLLLFIDVLLLFILLFVLNFLLVVFGNELFGSVLLI